LFFGCALISADSGGPRELLENGKSGILVEPGNREKMAEAIINLALNPEKRSALGKEARKYVRHKFNPDVCAKQLSALYTGVLAEKQS